MKKSYLKPTATASERPSYRSKPTQTTGDVMTLNEAADYLRISRHSLQRGVESGEVPALKMGSLYRFSRKALEETMKTTLTHPEKIPKVDDGTSRRRKGDFYGDGGRIEEEKLERVADSIL